jgi:hypothetical protein
MKVYDVYSNGKKIETYGYIYPEDMYGDYLGHMIEYRGSIYEVVTDMNGVLLDPMGTPVIIAPNMETILDHYDKNKEVMPEIVEKYDYDIKNESDTPGLVVDSGVIYYKGKQIYPINE